MNFVEKLLGFLGDGFNFIGDYIQELIDFIAEPLAFILSFLEGVFHLINTLFDVAIKLINLFVALFQFIFSIIEGVFRTINIWLNPFVNQNTIVFPSNTQRGFDVVLEQIAPIGFTSIIPLILVALTWFGFAVKVIGLIGGNQDSIAEKG